MCVIMVVGGVLFSGFEQEEGGDVDECEDVARLRLCFRLALRIEGEGIVLFRKDDDGGGGGG
jgi:hypothetical protein